MMELAYYRMMMRMMRINQSTILFCQSPSSFKRLQTKGLDSTRLLDSLLFPTAAAGDEDLRENQSNERGAEVSALKIESSSFQEGRRTGALVSFSILRNTHRVVSNLD
jgi:hypothetical protein